MRRVSPVSFLSLTVIIVVAVSLGSCGKKKSNKRGPKPFRSPPSAITAAGGSGPTATRGLTFRLENGQAITGPRATIATGTPLTAAQTQRLLGRLPALAPGQDAKAFAFRARSLPPPRTGRTVTTAFPPPAGPPPVAVKAKGPLKVRRVQPTGDVGIAPRLSVTFSQPMIAVTSHADSIAKGVPVKLSPEIPGVWRWIGTRTLLFEAKARLPMATEFSAEVPVGTKSAVGGELAEAKRWTFRTPAPRVIAQHPTGGPHRVNPIFFVGFDQKIDALQVLSNVRLETEAGQDQPIRAATEREIRSDPRVAAMVAQWRKGPAKHRYVTFVPQQMLEANTGYVVRVRAGTPSAEGPRRTEKDQTFKMRTYAPLAIVRTNCRAKYRCQPGSPLVIHFNNPLDIDRLPKKGFSVSPTLDKQKISASYRTITIWGETKGRRTYAAIIPGTVRDRYGQTLGSKATRRFYFRSATPRLFSLQRSLYVADPSGDKALRVNSVNHRQIKVKIWRVPAKDFDQHQRYVQAVQRARWRKALTKPIPPHPGNLVSDKVVTIDGYQEDKLIESAIALKPALDAKGHGQVAVEVTQWPLPQKRRDRIYLHHWIQVTDIAVDALAGHTTGLAWVTRLKDGKPVAGARIEVGAQTGTTDQDGLARLPLPMANTTVNQIIARRAGDVAFLLDSSYRWSRTWQGRTMPGVQLRWFVFDDRKLYKPKETVSVKGYVRLVDTGRKNAITLLPAQDRAISYVVKGPRGNKVAQGKTQVGELGGFDFTFKLPDNVNLGYASIRLESTAAVPNNSHTHSFRIQEFRRPEFEVSSKASEGPYYIGGHADVAVTARYFSGGPLPGAPVRWNVSARKGYFSPPKIRGFHWGADMPDWARANQKKSRRASRPGSWFPARDQSHSGQTDGKGTHRLRVHFDAVDPPTAVSVTTRATVTDVNRQTWTTTRHLLVHPARVYVGLKSKKYFYRRGERIDLQVLVADPSGKKVAGRPVEVTAWRRKWEVKNWKWKAVRADRQQCRVTSAATPAVCKFETKNGGQYLFVARTTDAKGKATVTTMPRWVSGGRMKGPKGVKKEQVRLLRNKTDAYEPGETAEILVQAPFYPAEGLLTVRRLGILRQERFTMKGPTHTLKVPLTEMHMPALQVAVNLVGSAVRLDANGDPATKLPPRPAYASGSVTLPVSYKRYRLELGVKPRRKALLPGGRTVIDVSLKDHTGKPMAGEVALVAVDEAVLALTGYSISDPLGYFFPWRSPGVRERHLRQLVSLLDPGQLDKFRKQLANEGKNKDSADDKAAGAPSSMAATGRRRGAMQEARKADATGTKSPAKDRKPEKKKATGGKKKPGIKIRKQFSALALFAPRVKVGANGQATVPIQLPDSLTRYRIMAVAVSGASYFGRGDDTIVARQPLGLRPAAPRFLNFGDRFTFPVVVQNRTEKPLEVSIGVRGSNVRFLGAAGQKVTIPAQDRREVRFAATTVAAGRARFQIAAAARADGREVTDAAQLALPVWTPATTEAFATYGTIDKGAMAQPVQMPKGVIKQFGGLEIGTSSTALQALTDAVLYLYAYPYECSEQISSRVLAVAALRDVLASFKARGFPGKAAIEVAMARDLRRLRAMQNYDGGWGFWRAGHESWPYLSIHVSHALARAKQKGYKVSKRMWNLAQGYLKQIERHIPSRYPERIKQVIIAYSLYVRQVAGDLDVAKAKTTYRALGSAKKAPLEAVAWLYPVMSGQTSAETEIAEIRKMLQNRVTETAAAAHFRTAYSDGAHLILHSNRRVDGILLEALIKDQPKSDLVAKIVRGLLAHRKRGRWLNTQENVFILLALDRYFNVYEKTTPNFVAKVWLGKQFAGQHAFRGRTTERHRIDIPMAALGEPGDKQNLVLQKAGPGRLYYRIGMRYAPADLRPPPADHGFVVRRRYEAADNPTDVTRAKDGTWQVKAGARVRVVVTMVAPTRRYHVALVDPLPAGFEPLNPALRGTGPLPTKKQTRRGWGGKHHFGRGRRSYRSWRWYRPQWYEHQNLRDERAEAFTSLLWGGVHTYTYYVRATTPGTFVAPPPKAEEMYHPETFGRGPGDKVIVK